MATVEWSTLSDAEIMLRVSAGEDAGFTYLLEKYRKPIVNFMFRMVRNQAVAEELAQEVFLRVYRSRETYRAEARFSTCLLYTSHSGLAGIQQQVINGSTEFLAVDPRFHGADVRG